jgi:hypothetical protein
VAHDPASSQRKGPKGGFEEDSQQKIAELVGAPLRFHNSKIASELYLEEKPDRSDIFGHKTWMRAVFVGVSSRDDAAPDLAFLSLLRDNGEMVRECTILWRK